MTALLFLFLLLLPLLPIALALGKKACKPPVVVPPASPHLPIQFTADRVLAAVWGLPGVACALLMLGVIGLNPDGFVSHPFIVLLVLGTAVVAGWAGWFFGHNVIWPDHLLLTREGVTLQTFRRVRFWCWDDIADAYAGSAGAPLSDAVIILKTDDPVRIPFVRWGILKSARTIPLGKMWKTPFGTMAAAMITDTIRGVLAARRNQPSITAQVSG